MRSKQSAFPSDPVQPEVLHAIDKEKLKALRALFVSSACFDQMGNISSVSFFPPSEVQGAIVAQTMKSPTGPDISGQSPKIMELKAKLAACENDDKRIAILQELRHVQSEDMIYWSAD
jgi:hypothetical protein